MIVSFRFDGQEAHNVGRDSRRLRHALAHVAAQSKFVDLLLRFRFTTFEFQTRIVIVIAMQTTPRVSGRDCARSRCTARTPSRIRIARVVLVVVLVDDVEWCKSLPSFRL